MKKFISFILMSVSLFSVGNAEINKIDIDVQVIESKNYYKANFERPLYTACTYRFDNVVKVGDYDIAAYNAALCRDLKLPSAESPSELLDKWRTAWAFADQFCRVGNIGKSISCNEWYETHPEDKSQELDAFPYGAPYENISLVYDGYNADAHVLGMLLRYDAYLGGGTGASHIVSDVYYYYDFDEDRRLYLSDLFEKDCNSVLLESVRQWLSENADEVCLSARPDEVWLSDNWELRTNCIVFIYPKYEIACGAAGNVEVPVYVYGCGVSDYLNAKGRALFRVFE